MDELNDRSNQHIGAAGELLVQYQLLKYGVDSARMTTDSGIDLVAYSPLNEKSYTIQVKTKDRPTRSGGSGKNALDWFLKHDTTAELIALVSLEKDKVWIFELAEFKSCAQQTPEGKAMHLYMYTEQPLKTKHAHSLESDFESFLLVNKIKRLFYDKDADASQTAQN